MEGNRGGQQRGACYMCGNMGYYARSCPRGVSKPVESTQVAGVVPVNIRVTSDQVEFTMVGLSAAGDLPPSIQTCLGVTNGQVTVMLDSGNTAVGVRRLVKQFLGDVDKVEKVTIHLNCQYFCGEIDACVVDEPVSDVVLGRVPGANFQCTEIVNAVQTRAQKVREARPFRPLLTTKSPQLDISGERLAELQKSDGSLAGVFQRVDEPVVIDSGAR